MSRSVACKPSGPPSNNSAAAMPPRASPVSQIVRRPAGYQTGVPSLPRRASNAWRTRMATGTAFSAAKIAATRRSLAASNTTLAVSPACAAAPAPSHSPAANSGSCVK